MDWVALELGQGHVVAMTLARVDRLDEVNATLGLDAGDLMMRLMAGRLRGLTPPGVRTARLADGVFLLASTGRTRDEVGETARRILLRMRERLHIGDISPSAAVSVGIAHSDAWSTARRMLPDAHLALGAARRGGGDRMSVFDDAERVATRARLRTEQDLSWALSREQIEVHYQPVYDLRTNRAVGAEALSRWNQPGRGDIPPGTFIPVATRSRLIDRLTTGVIREAAAATAAWSVADPGWVTWINAHPRLLAEGALARTLGHHRALNGLGPAALGLEITEQDLSEPRETAARLAEMAGRGMLIAIDDFGTGHSSLARLRDLPVHAIKIDRSFVRASHDAPGARMLGAIVGLGRAAGKTVIAEGIESAGELHAVREAGCDMASGHYFGPTTEAAGVAASCELGRRMLQLS